MSKQVVEKLKGKFGNLVLDTVEHRGETSIRVERAEIVAVCTFLRDDCGYNFLSDLCGVDYLGRTPRFEVVYNMYNLTNKT
ncbi:MAG: NADH-quinone oxidoreductase subunit C, partial [Desulfuromonadales bacterium]|nr:NADH-quinone oxidoreductase subunit C [Desulfuromonadales bacterium]